MTTTHPRALLRFETVGEYSGTVRITAWENVAVCAWDGQANGPATAVVARSMDRPQLRGRRGSYVHLIRD